VARASVDATSSPTRTGVRPHATVVVRVKPKAREPRQRAWPPLGRAHKAARLRGAYKYGLETTARQTACSNVVSGVRAGAYRLRYDHARWHRPNSYRLLDGRLVAGEYPGDRDDAAACAKLGALLDAGVTCFVDLTEPHELDAYHEILAEEAATRGVQARHVRLPIVDISVPSAPEKMRTILDTIDGELTAGGRVHVHCWGGPCPDSHGTIQPRRLVPDASKGNPRGSVATGRFRLCQTAMHDRGPAELTQSFERAGPWLLHSCNDERSDLLLVIRQLHMFARPAAIPNHCCLGCNRLEARLKWRWFVS
jgi:hypothetical protein